MSTTGRLGGSAVTRLASLAIVLTILMAALFNGSGPSSGAVLTDSEAAAGNTATAAKIVAPAAPNATASSTKAIVAWTPSSSPAVGCQQVQRATASTGPWSTIATLADNTTSTYTDTDVAAGASYVYRVVAAVRAACYWPTPGPSSNSILIPAKAYTASGSCDGPWTGTSSFAPLSCVAWGIKADGSIVTATAASAFTSGGSENWATDFTDFAASGPYVASGSCDGAWGLSNQFAPRSCLAWGIKADGTIVSASVVTYGSGSPTWVTDFTDFAASGPYVASGSCDSTWTGLTNSHPTSCMAWGIKADGTIVTDTVATYGGGSTSSSPTFTMGTDFAEFAGNGPYVATGNCDGGWDHPVNTYPTSCIAWGVTSAGTMTRSTAASSYNLGTATWSSDFTAMAAAAG